MLRVAQVREERRPGFLASVFQSGGRRATPTRAGGEGAETRLLKARAQEESRAQARAHAASESLLAAEVRALEADAAAGQADAAALAVELRGAHELHGEASARAASLAAELEARRAEAEGLRASASAREAEGLYLRNVVKKYMETEQHEALFPVIATCMHFSQVSK